MKGVILWSILVTGVIATDGDVEVSDTRMEQVGNSLYQYDLAVLGTILAIKFKAVIIVIVVILGIAVYYKSFPGFGNNYKGFKCPPPIYYDVKHKYSYDAEPPYGHTDRHDRASDFTVYYENLDFELLATVMKGIGLEDLSFNITDKANAPCRRRLVCEADRLASKNPVVGYAIDLLRGLSRYRISRSSNQRGYDCAVLYPHCTSSRGSQRQWRKNQKMSGLSVQNRREQ